MNGGTVLAPPVAHRIVRVLHGGKLRLTSRVQAAIYAYRAGLVQ